MTNINFVGRSISIRSGGLKSCALPYSPTATILCWSVAHPLALLHPSSNGLSVFEIRQRPEQKSGDSKNISMFS